VNYDHHYILGVSLGGPTEHTTVALADQFLVSSGGNFLVQKTHVVDIERHAPGIPLPDLVAAIHALKRKLGDDADWRGPCLVLDIGSAGWAVHDMLSARDREHYVRMVAGIGERGGSRGERLLGRQELIGLVRREVHTDRLKLARDLPLFPALEKAMLGFTERQATARQVEGDLGREADDEDLVLAVGVAAWHSLRFTPQAREPRLNVISDYNELRPDYGPAGPEWP